MNTKQTISLHFLMMLLLFGLLTPIAAAQPLFPAQTPTLTANVVDSWTKLESFVPQDVGQKPIVAGAAELLDETIDLLLLNFEIQYELYSQ
ncbi:MAG: hypothetical protein AAF614_21160 [Chloroflexota bacterium]